MKLTIIPESGSVYENGVSYSGLSWSGTPPDVHALQWDTAAGWIEFSDGKPNEQITELPEWALNAEAAWTAANEPPPPPTPEEIQEMNKSEAVTLLQNTDWAATVDITDPQYSNPYLGNQVEFLTYRSEVRQIAVDPPTTLITVWPVVPSAIWEYV